ncbi:hypothetical protein CHS0354_036190 [Potamilus streckersoni]|uniref:Uncharacterized protein n=1 Tax=Potamilus streckersoni TaxID=2493646 RepID=A0AAE0SVP4_9BIVA|nr:hypothetical protein CHS0354_036190 [Potamilus streckersoni]
MELSRSVSVEIQGGVNPKRPIFMGDSYHSKMYHKCETPIEALSYDEVSRNTRSTAN